MEPAPAPPDPSRQPPSLPVVALVLACLGLCIPLLGCAGFVLGVVGIISALRDPSYGRMGFSIGAVGASVVGVGILALIAVPNFLMFQARSKQGECKVNLKGAFIVEKSFFIENDAYEMNPAKVGWAPEHGNRYLYRLGPREDEVVPADTARFPEVDNAALEAALAKHAGPLGVNGRCPDCSITIGCAANVDRDDDIDVWTISNVDRPDAPAGVPFNDHSDL